MMHNTWAPRAVRSVWWAEKDMLATEGREGENGGARMLHCALENEAGSAIPGDQVDRTGAATRITEPPGVCCCRLPGDGLCFQYCMTTGGRGAQSGREPSALLFIQQHARSQNSLLLRWKKSKFGASLLQRCLVYTEK